MAVGGLAVVPEVVHQQGIEDRRDANLNKRPERPRSRGADEVVEERRDGKKHQDEYPSANCSSLEWGFGAEVEKVFEHAREGAKGAIDKRRGVCPVPRKTPFSSRTGYKSSLTRAKHLSLRRRLYTTEFRSGVSGPVVERIWLGPNPLGFRDESSVLDAFALAPRLEKWVRRLFPALCRAWLQAKTHNSRTRPKIQSSEWGHPRSTLSAAAMYFQREPRGVALEDGLRGSTAPTCP